MKINKLANALFLISISIFFTLFLSIFTSDWKVEQINEEMVPTTVQVEIATVHIEAFDIPVESLTPAEELSKPIEQVQVYSPLIPLPETLQNALYNACNDYDVPVPLALGLIEVESCFDVNSDNGLCYGLCQLNRNYFPDNLSPEDNIRFGMEYLGRLLKQYDDVSAALTAYNAGYDTGYRGYANSVLETAYKYGFALSYQNNGGH